MLTYSLDQEPKYTKTEIFSLINCAISSKNHEDIFDLPEDRFLSIAFAFREIQDQDLLIPTIKIVREMGFLKEYDRIVEDLKTKNVFKSLSYSIRDLNKILSLLCGSYMIGEIRLLISGAKQDLPNFEFDIIGRNVQVNTDVVSNFSKKTLINNFVDHTTNLPTVLEKEVKLKNIISFLAEYNYNSQNDFFQPDINYLTTLKDNLSNISVHISNGRYRREIFPESEVHQLFFEYLINEVFTDRNGPTEASFIYWQMSRDGFIASSLKPTPFFQYLNKKHGYDLDRLLPKMKTFEMNDAAILRNDRYSEAKTIYKL
jgi:hypothetical protein